VVFGPSSQKNKELDTREGLSLSFFFLARLLSSSSSIAIQSVSDFPPRLPHKNTMPPIPEPTTSLSSTGGIYDVNESIRSHPFPLDEADAPFFAI
jgi:hypothetical protein